MTGRYVNPYTDFGFKLLFGTPMNKDLLIGFLNALLRDEAEITDVTYLNAEQLGRAEGDRKAVFDVYCENVKGERFIVEMQKARRRGRNFSKTGACFIRRSRSGNRQKRGIGIMN